MLPLEKFFIMTEKLENVNVMSVFVILDLDTASFMIYIRILKTFLKKFFFLE